MDPAPSENSRPEPESSDRLRLVVLGGIGSGKTAVGSLLETVYGVHVVDADTLGHEVLENEARADIQARWPQAVRDGAIDRRVLADIVFVDPAELAALEALTHPRIADRITVIASTAEGDLAVEIPLLVDLTGPGWTRLVVDAPDEVRRRRLAARGLSATQVEARMNAQPSREAWLAAADHVIDNSGSREDLERSVRDVMTLLDSIRQQTGRG